MWSVLFAALPTQPTAVRVRTWRALKALGSPALRDGAYLLPIAKENLFEPVADDIRAHDGTALVMRLEPGSDRQRDEILALFDRSAAYAEWSAQLQALHQGLDGLTEGDARRSLRTLASSLNELTDSDHYPGAAAAQAAAALDGLRAAIEARFSPGEPQALAAHAVPRLERAPFRGQVWATRRRPWVDRLASGWLIGRFIDPEARFVWLADTARPPRGAIGYDYDGARFTHVGALVTFEVLAASFALESDNRLRRIAASVRYLDAGGIPAPEAAGLEAVLAGLREQHADDNLLLTAAAAVFDALYMAPTTSALDPAA
jgi:hypothetical protein